MIYLTYNDSPSGVYYSQVTDTCNYFQNSLKHPISLVAIISLRNFFENRKKIKSQYSNSIVLPMFPKQRNWKCNIITLFFVSLFCNSKGVIARGPFACSFALKLKKWGLVKKVCFDARGAYTAELNEYTVVEDEGIKNSIEQLEKEVLFDADFRLAVSSALVDYWKKKFGYVSTSYVIIPCTLNSNIQVSLRDELSISKTKEALGIKSNEILLVYSGSVAAWQSFEVMDVFLYNLFVAKPNVKILFLSPSLPSEFMSAKGFPKNVIQQWVLPNEVEAFLSVCDYGLILREFSITNKVASPIKFAEYLLSGLPVIISENIGDFSDFVMRENSGIVLNEQSMISESLQKNTLSRRQKMNALATTYLSKGSYNKEYNRLIEAILT